MCERTACTQVRDESILSEIMICPRGDIYTIKTEDNIAEVYYLHSDSPQQRATCISAMVRTLATSNVIWLIISSNWKYSDIPNF